MVFQRNQTNSPNLNNNQMDGPGSRPGSSRSAASLKPPGMLPKISLLALFFGMGSWIAITGLWLEMPLLLQKLPEGWRLASHLNIMIQFANIGPLLYWYAAQKRKWLNEVSATHIQMLIGMASCALLILAWDATATIAGREHSVVLFGATFGLALVDCTSSVTFLPFMARFDSAYMTPYLVGEGLSGFIPSMVALLQGVGENRKECRSSTSHGPEEGEIALNGNSTRFLAGPGSLPLNGSTLLVLDTVVLENTPVSKLIEPRFSVEIFFFSLFFTIAISYVGFCALQILPDCREEMERTKQRVLRRLNRKASLKVAYARVSEESVHMIVGPNGQRVSAQLESIDLGDSEDEKKEDLIKKQEPTRHDDTRRLAKQRRIYYYLLGLMCFNCFTTFGFFPSVQPYSALPYGVETLHYVVILSGLAYPAGCFFGMLVEHKSVQVISALTLAGTIIGLYILTCALLSPSPPFRDTSFGGILMIIAWIAFVAILSYAKTMITLWICDFNSRKGMFWVGMNTQFGAAAGALLNFILINYSRLFNEC